MIALRDSPRPFGPSRITPVHLGGQHDLVAAGEVLQRPAGDLLAGPQRVHVRGVEEVDPGLDGLPDQRAAGFLVQRPRMTAAARLAEAHAAQADAGHVHPRPAQRHVLHARSSVSVVGVRPAPTMICTARGAARAGPLARPGDQALPGAQDRGVLPRRGRFAGAEENLTRRSRQPGWDTGQVHRHEKGPHLVDPQAAVEGDLLVAGQVRRGLRLAEADQVAGEGQDATPGRRAGPPRCRRPCRRGAATVWPRCVKPPDADASQCIGVRARSRLSWPPRPPAVIGSRSSSGGTATSGRPISSP